MNKTYPFKWLDESENLIVVNVEVNEETSLRFLLDTGASETCFDKNIGHGYFNPKESLFQF